jgi:hypothetical protein
MTMMTDAHRGRAMTITTTDATTARETRMADLPARGSDRAMVTTTGVARGHLRATMTIDAHRGRAMTIMTTDATTARETRMAGLPARGRDRAMTMTTGVARGHLRVTTTIDAHRGHAMTLMTTDVMTARATRKAGLPARGRDRAMTMTTGVARGHAMTIMTTDATTAHETRKAGLPVRGRDRAMTMTTGAAAATMAAGSVTPRVMRKLLGTGAVSLRF